jgi:hypothetical protein
MKNYSLLLASLVATVGLAGCGSDENPAPPALGTQIDRMGRAGVNTAVTDPFNQNSTTKGAAQDNYNAASSTAQWSAFANRFAGNLAILDALDTVCGNQLLAGPTASAGRYSTLASVLADDQIYLNTSSGTCTTYLAVEANAVGIANNDCGGRTPIVDVIDRTYSVLAAGALSGVTDGVDRDADATQGTTAFPFLAAPVK